MRMEPALPDCRRMAELLNRECLCVSLDREALRLELAKDPVGADLYDLVIASRPHMFSESTVFVGEASLKRMEQVVHAVEQVVDLPAYQQSVLSWAPAAAAHAPGARGVFLGYDFHLGAAGPRLIEINTNAGGGLLNAVLARAQEACCESVAAMLPGSLGRDAEHAFVEMFVEEWRSERDRELKSIAIVDDRPAEQYLWPEFVLFRKLFERHGYTACIVDAAALEYRGGLLRAEGEPVDLVYNRLTDFYFEEPAHRALRDAYMDGAAVVTPHPRAHALYADKRNLALLTDEAELRRMGADEATIALLLAAIPRTQRVRRADADDLWQRRRSLFFKPAAGYGSKAAYRGDKITRRVFDDILCGEYVAQELVPPSERHVEQGGERVALKLDLRNYVYRDRVQLVSARLYRGQTTNFRTPGGGFAPVLTVPCVAC